LAARRAVWARRSRMSSPRRGPGSRSLPGPASASTIAPRPWAARRSAPTSRLV